MNTPTLQVTSPYMGARTFDNAELRSYIRDVQRLVGVAPQDGVYGPATAGAVKHWKHAFGFHTKFVTTQLTPAEAQWLVGAKKQTVAQKLRAAARKPDVNQALALTVGQRGKNTMIAWAQRNLSEAPPYSNKVPFLHDYALRQGIKSWYANMGWPWCAFSAFLSSYAWGSKAAKAGFAGKFNVLYVPEVLNQARAGNFGMRVVSYADAQPGDLVIFNWDGGVPDHIGRLIAKMPNNLSIQTVEGNTSPGANGSQSDGGGVFVRIRSLVNVQAFVRES